MRSYHRRLFLHQNSGCCLLPFFRSSSSSSSYFHSGRQAFINGKWLSLGKGGKKKMAISSIKNALPFVGCAVVTHLFGWLVPFLNGRMLKEKSLQRVGSAPAREQDGTREWWQKYCNVYRYLCAFCVYILWSYDLPKVSAPFKVGSTSLTKFS